MTITFNVNELRQYANDLQNWYNKQLEYVLTNLRLNPYEMREGHQSHEQIYRLRERFEKENPKPKWQDLL